MSLIIKIILITLSLSSAFYRQNTILCPFKFLQLINGNSNDLQKLLKFFNGTAIVAFLNIPLGGLGLGWVSPSDLSIYSKGLKLLSLAISALKLVASSFE